MTVACMNKAKTPLGYDFDKLTATLQKCYDQYFLPIWGYQLTLYNTTSPKPSDWQFIYFDDADTAGALGYHDLTQNDQPISKIFVKTTLDGLDQRERFQPDVVRPVEVDERDFEALRSVAHGVVRSLSANVPAASPPVAGAVARSRCRPSSFSALPWKMS